jgi:hypothetical protein
VGIPPNALQSVGGVHPEALWLRPRHHKQQLCACNSVDGRHCNATILSAQPTSETVQVLARAIAKIGRVDAQLAHCFALLSGTVPHQRGLGLCSGDATYMVMVVGVLVVGRGGGGGGGGGRAGMMVVVVEVAVAVVAVVVHTVPNQRRCTHAVTHAAGKDPLHEDVRGQFFVRQFLIW